MKRVKSSGFMKVQARYNRTAGLDTDKNFVVVALFDALTGKGETRDFEQNMTGAIKASQWLIEQNIEKAIIESTANYHLLFYDTLRSFKVPVYVINPIIVKSLLRVEGKSDKADAFTLARLAASFDIRTSNMPDAHQREIRNTMRWTDKEKQNRTRLLNMINGMLTASGVTVFRMISVNSRSGRDILTMILRGMKPEQIAEVYRGRKYTKEDIAASIQGIPLYLHERLGMYRADLERLNERISYLEERTLKFESQFGLEEQIKLMMTVPAVSKLLALRIIGEMGQDYWNRYSNHRAFTKAIGLAPSNEVSGGKLLKRRSSHGNKALKVHFRNSTKAAVLHMSVNDPLKKWFTDYRSRSNYPRAINALARRLAEGVYMVGLKSQPYYPSFIRHWSPPEPIELDPDQVDPDDLPVDDELTGEDTQEFPPLEN